MTRTVTERPSFQGDIMVRRIPSLPAGLKPAPAENGVHILAHSETGHHHVIEERAAQKLIDETNAFVSYLRAVAPGEILHLRDFDTHEPLGIEKGALYEVRNAREFGVEGWRRTSD